MLSVSATTLVQWLFLISFATVPRHGAINGNQYRIKTKSGFFFLIVVPKLNQVNGLIELSDLWMVKSVGLSPSSYWDLPGKRREGYCVVKVWISTWCPIACHVRARLSLNAAIPPLKG